MHKRLLLLLATTFLACGAAMTSDDKELSKRIAGTWVSNPSETWHMLGTVTYNPDGTGTEVVWLRDESEGAGVKVTTRWSITNGVLYIKSIASTNPKRIPVGAEIKERIISISANTFVLEALDGHGEVNGRRATLFRKNKS